MTMTAIQAFCKLCEDEKAIAANTEKYRTTNTEVTIASGTYKFSKVFEKHSKMNTVYMTCFEDLEKYFFSGYNASFLFLGHLKDQASFLAGEKGLFLYLAEQLYNEYTKQGKVKESRKQLVTSARQSRKVNDKDDVHLRVYEIQHDKIKDLLDTRSCDNSSTRTTTASQHKYSNSEVIENSVQLIEDDFNGYTIKYANVFSFAGSSLKTLLRTLQDAVARSQLPHRNASFNLVIEFCVTKNVDGYDVPVTSWFRLMCLSAPFDNISEKSYLDYIIECLPVVSTTPAKVASRSTVMLKLLADVIGGNCVTRFMFLLEPYVTPSNTRHLESSMKLSNLYNYPVENSPHIKSLLRQYRIKIKALERKVSEEKNIDEAFIDELQEKLLGLEKTNARLNGENLRLENMLNNMKEKYNKAVVLHTEVTSKNVFSTAEKLKMSKESIDLRIHANKIQQEAEKQLYGMKNKLLAEQEKSSKLERNLAFERKVHGDLKEKFAAGQKDKKDLMEEYINLKTNYQSMNARYQQQRATNEELNGIVSKLSQLKEKMILEKTDMQYQQIKSFNEHLQKLKATISNKEKEDGTFKTEDFSSKKLFHQDNDTTSTDVIQQLQEEHHKELQSSESLMFSLKKRLVQNEETVGNYNKKLAQVTSRMLILRDEKEFVEARLTDVETKLMNLSHEYTARLHQYVNDLKALLSNENPKNNNNNEGYIQHLDKMTKDLEIAYNNELSTYQEKLEEQRKTSQMIVVQHEKLLIAYRLLLKKHNVEYIEDEISSYEVFLPPTDEIQAVYTKERNELRTKLCITEERVKELEDKVGGLKMQIQNQELNGELHSLSTGNTEKLDIWSVVRKKMRDFTTTVQHNLEKEKAELLTRCHLAEQELETYREIMNENYRRYELEIDHLQHQLSDQRFKNVDNNHMLAIESESGGGLFPPINKSRYKQYERR